MLKLNKTIVCLGFMLMFSVGNSYSTEISPLVDTDWLSKNLENNNVLVLGIRKQAQDFYKGHIPRAVLVKEPKMAVYRDIGGKKLRGYLPDQNYFEEFLKLLGVNNNSHLILLSFVHGNKNTKYVTGLYWQLKVFGFDNVSILDGGFKKWASENRPVEKGSGRDVVKGGVKLISPKIGMVYETDDILSFQKSKDNMLIDFRDFASYIGVKKSDDVLDYGHISGAYAVPEELFFNEDGTVISALNISLSKPIAIYCNTGNHATEGWFIFHEVLSKPDIYVYDGSLMEWTNLGHKLVKYKMDNYG
mgnify:CR=1 FL=1